ncbi:MAG: AGE family epimerase/isomerase [Phycisphaerae bacterium]|nr:AGE family epimerase/isomerase [Phycisphaerae bacterium]
MLDVDYLRELNAFYRMELLENILPFWLRHGRDLKHGGYHTCLNRDGSVYDDDKLCMWNAGRIIWTFSFLYNELQQNDEWLEMARHGVMFLRQHGFASDGKMYYSLTREGRPLERPRDVYTELFAVLGLTEYARATGEEPLYQRAQKLMLRLWDRIEMPGKAHQPFVTETRAVRLHGHSMITLNVLQTLRLYAEEPLYSELIDQCLETILHLHTKRDRRCVLEVVEWDGQEVPGTKGRWINPGHMIEGGTFIIHEGRHRGDDALVEKGLELIEWGFDWGWDKAFGGLFNDVDCRGLPVPTVEALLYDAKLWWQHAEALYATLLAYCLTGRESFLDAYRLTHAYSFEKFADPEYGEWFAMLDRRGNRINDAKGTARKSPFHIARNFYLCHRLLSEVLDKGGGALNA